VLRASGEAVWTWPSVIAGEAGPMQIRWREEAELSRVEPVLLGTTPDAVRADIAYGKKYGEDCGARSWKKGSV
jgi:hypothetical protein